jgi:hypothetical protein
MEINGFEIDNYNHLVLKTDKKNDVCPFCSADEKRKQINVFRFIGIQVFLTAIIVEKKDNYTFKRKENNNMKPVLTKDKSRLQR